MNSLSSKNIVVIGAGGTIGREVARVLAAEGAAVAATDIDDTTLTAVRAALEAENAKHYLRAIDAAERELDGKGRVVVRYSGTEPLARVMVEAESEEKMQALTAGIAGEIQKALGV